MCIKCLNRVQQKIPKQVQITIEQKISNLLPYKKSVSDITANGEKGAPNTNYDGLGNKTLSHRI